MRVARNAAAVALALFTACSTVGSGDVRQWKGELPVAEPFLRTQLPPGTIAYMRVPNLLGLLSMPKQGQFDAAQRSEANVRAVASIQEGLAENVLVLPSFSDPRLKFIADAVRSPVEVAGFATPLPAGLIGVTLSARSAEDFNQLLAGLGEARPSVRLAAPLDKQGIGELVGLPLKVFVKFDPSTGRLLLGTGPMVDRASFENVLGSMPARLDDHAMYALEQKIDASGQGLFAWVDAAQITPALGPVVGRRLGDVGFGGLRGVAFGLGTANGQGRMSLVLDVGNNRNARPLPVIENDIRATSVGDPDAAIVFSIPGQAEIARLEAMLLGTLPSNARDGWEQAKARFGERIGASVKEILAAIGPDVVALFDRVGDYTAVRLRDPKLFDDIVRRIAAKTGSTLQEHKAGGASFQYWRLPSFVSIAANAVPEAPARPDSGGDLLELLGRSQTHVYWVREGEYLYVAQTPQPLIDRVRAGARGRVGDWLAKTQRMDTSASLFAATATLDKMPRRSYEMYIGMLQFLADISRAEFDAWSMPTADQLGLPEKGAIGFSLNLGEPYLSLELTYENHPGELLFGGGGMGTVAALGILAGIAIPAYQDYTIRAQVTEGLNLAAPVKAAVAESYATRGVPPADRRAAGLQPAPDSSSGRYVEGIDVSRGLITVTYGNNANPRLRGRRLVITPLTNAERDLLWVCGYRQALPGAQPLPGSQPLPGGANAGEGTNIEPKYLPSACR